VGLVQRRVGLEVVLVGCGVDQQVHAMRQPAMWNWPLAVNLEPSLHCISYVKKGNHLAC
jgi:hypothetical protein